MVAKESPLPSSSVPSPHHVRFNADPSLDVKPSNVLVSWRPGMANDVEILDVVLSDTEDAAKVLEGECIDGTKPGNVYWRSPEAKFGNVIDRKTDIFSFGSLVGSPSLSRGLLSHQKLHER